MIIDSNVTIKITTKLDASRAFFECLITAHSHSNIVMCSFIH